MFGTIGATHNPWNPNPQFRNWSVNNRSRVIITDTIHLAFFVLFGISLILTESQETIAKGHDHRVKQIRSDHLVRSSWRSSSLRNQHPSRIIPSLLAAPQNFIRYSKYNMAGLGTSGAKPMMGGRRKTHRKSHRKSQRKSRKQQRKQQRKD